MFTYETGVFFAFLFWLFGIINLLITINSRMARNLNKIGQCISWLTLQPTLMTEDDQKRTVLGCIGKFLLIAGVGIPFIFLSWLYVAVFLCSIIYRLSKDFGAPQSIKEFRWKMRNLEMPRDQIIKEIMKIGGGDPTDQTAFEEAKQLHIEGMRERGLRVSG